MGYRIASAYFTPSRKHESWMWEMFRDGLARSVDWHCGQGVELRLVELPEPEQPGNYPAQNWKLREWVRQAEEALVDGVNLVLVDVDTLFLRDVEEVFDLGFDVAVTRRDRPHWLNAGVVYLQPTVESVAIMRMWESVDSQMLADTEYDRHVRRTVPHHMGQNQPAFAYLYEQGRLPGAVEVLECAVWNVCEDIYWRNMREDAAVLHVKSQLRQALAGNREVLHQAVHPDEAPERVRAPHPLLIGRVRRYRRGWRARKPEWSDWDAVHAAYSLYYPTKEVISA